MSVKGLNDMKITCDTGRKRPLINKSSQNLSSFRRSTTLKIQQSQSQMHDECKIESLDHYKKGKDSSKGLVVLKDSPVVCTGQCPTCLLCLETIQQKPCLAAQIFDT